MLYACTLCDKNYALKGLAMYKSLLKTYKGDALLYWLCLDNETFVQVGEMNLPGIILFRIDDLDAEYDLASVRNRPNAIWGDDHANFCWRLPPIFIDYLLKLYMPDGGKLIYVDSDITFYHSPQIILDIVGHKSVGIHTHRFSGRFDDSKETGWYNVGVMVFTNNLTGKAVTGQWCRWMADPATDLYKKYGTCGDQKWLNLFIPTFGHLNICVFDEEGDCGHLAPWNCTGIGHPQKHFILYNGHKQPVVFFHFSHFRIENGQWRDSLHGEWKPAADPAIAVYYQEYFEALQS